jgi:hypothetical protein
MNRVFPSTQQDSLEEEPFFFLGALALLIAKIPLTAHFMFRTHGILRPLRRALKKGLRLPETIGHQRCFVFHI